VATICNNTGSLTFPPALYPLSSANIVGHKAPYVDVYLNENPIQLLLDTGADISVLPHSFTRQLFQSTSPTPPTTTVRSFGGQEFEVEGPHLLRVQVCGIDFIHPFYSLHTPTSPVAGYDFSLAAKLIIDTVGQSVYSGWNTSVGLTVTPLSQMSSIVQQPVDVSRYTPIMNPRCVPAASLTNEFCPASMMSESCTSQAVHCNATLPTHAHYDVPVVCETSNTQLLPQLLHPWGIVTSVPQLSSRAPGTASACMPTSGFPTLCYASITGVQ